MATRPAPDPHYVLRGHEAEVQALCFHPGKDYLYAGDSAGILTVWDLDCRRVAVKQRLNLPDAGITSVHYIAEEPAILLSQGRDGSLKLWKLDEQGHPSTNPLSTFQTFSYNFCRCVIQQKVQWAKAAPKPEGPQEESPDPNTCSLIAMSGSTPEDIEIWSLQERRLVRELVQPEGNATCGMCMALQFLPSGHHSSQKLLLLAGYEDGALMLWDVLQPQRPLAMFRAHTEPVMALAVSGNVAFSGAADNKICKLQIVEDEPLIKLVSYQELKDPGVADLAIRADDRILAAAGWDKKVRIFSIKALAPLAVLKYHRASVAAVAFSDRTQVLASAGRDNTVAIWRVFC